MRGILLRHEPHGVGAGPLLGPTIRSSIAKADGGQLEALARVVAPAPSD